MYKSEIIKYSLNYEYDRKVAKNNEIQGTMTTAKIIYVILPENH